MTRYFCDCLFVFISASICFGHDACRAAEDEPLLDGKPLSQVLEQLKGSNRGFQVRAARALAGASAELQPQIIPILIPLLKSDRENDRFVAAQVLGEYGPAARAAAPELLPLLQGTQFERNRAAAAKALGQIFKDAEPSEEVEKVAEALTAKFNEDYDKYSDVRRESVRALGMIGPAAKKCIPKLTRALTDFVLHSDEHRLVRQQAAWTCGRMGPLAAEHMDRLISMLHQSECWSTNMREVPEAIGLIGPINDNVVSNLITAYEGSQYPSSWLPFKEAILGALERFGPKSAEAVPFLARQLRIGGNLPLSLRTAMMNALAAIGPAAKEALPEIEKQLGPTGEPAAKAFKAVTGREPEKKK